MVPLYHGGFSQSLYSFYSQLLVLI
ncbi:hypothetical protein E2C01_087257 [Portunus trituberculatus]|uniref:Uncharacterized protein n=1 Tax=Portunus trituberculatus TaxID=210409 RepID=A0A5B7JCV1_PORTR|nr:hypothetical protein [Portunus trituberculatus]